MAYIRPDSFNALKAMLDSFDLILQYADCEYHQFTQDRMTQDAIMYRILAAGEAMRQFSDCYEGKNRKKKESRKLNSNAEKGVFSLDQKDFDDLMAMRDVLGHRIDQQDIDIVWETATVKVPLMLTPVWAALRTGLTEWLGEDHSPGALAAQKYAREEIVGSLQSIQTALEGSPWKSVEIPVPEPGSELDALIQFANNRLVDSPFTSSVNVASISLADVLFELRFYAAQTAIQEFLEGPDCCDDLWAYGCDDGPRAEDPDVYVDRIDLDYDLKGWSAEISGSLVFRGDEGEKLWTKEYTGVARGKIADHQPELDELEWNVAGSHEEDEWSEEQDWNEDVEC